MTDHELRRRMIPAGEARCAVFSRTYDAPIQDVWDACTDPARLARWYAPVDGDLRVGGSFSQGDFGSGVVVRCESPRLLTLAVGPGDPAPDEVVLRLRAIDDSTTELELEHATTFDTHEIAGGIYDAVYCMGGGYGPRLETLDAHLAGTLSPEVDATQLHLRAESMPFINASMAALAELLEQDKARVTV